MRRSCTLLLATLALAGAGPAAADPISLIGAMPPGSPEYSLFLVDANRLVNQSVPQAKAHLESQRAAIGLLAAYVNTDINATPITCGPIHFAAGEMYSYTEPNLPSVESPPHNLTLDRGVKQVFGSNFRVPLTLTDPFDPGHDLHVHFDSRMSKFGFVLQTTGTAGGQLITDTLTFVVPTDLDGDGVLEAVRIARVMTPDLIEFVGIDVPTGFTDVLVIPRVGDASYQGALLADRVASVPWTAPAGVGAGPGALALAMGPAMPTPTRGAASLSFTLPTTGRVTAAIFGPDGRLVRTLLAEERAAGRYRLAWDGLGTSGAATPPGVYFVRIAQGGQVAMRKIVRVP